MCCHSVVTKRPRPVFDGAHCLCPEAEMVGVLDGMNVLQSQTAETAWDAGGVSSGKTNAEPVDFARPNKVLQHRVKLLDGLL